MSPEMWPGFDEFRAKDPKAEGQYRGEGLNGAADSLGVEINPGCGEESCVVEEGEVDKGGEVDGVDAPWLRGPGSTR